MDSVGDSENQKKSEQNSQISVEFPTVSELRDVNSSVNEEPPNQIEGDTTNSRSPENISIYSSGHDYTHPTWPGPLLGKFPPPLPYLPKPRIGLDSAEVLNFPDIVIDSYFHQNSGFAGCISIRGNKKRHFGSTRQDSVAVFAAESDSSPTGLIHILIAADGVGSADMSHLASRQAVVLAMEELKNRANSSKEWNIQCAEIFDSVATGLTTFAHGLGFDVSRLITTLRIVKVIPDAVGNNSRIFAASVGDGVTYHLDADGKAKDNLGGEAGFGVDDQVSTATKALPNHYKYFEAKEFLISKGESVVIATDGAQEVWTAGIELGQLIADQNADAFQIAWALDVRARSATDDRSLSFWRQA